MSQLSFDLSEASQTPEVFSVSGLTRRVRALLESKIGEVWVEGEVSNLRKQASGHQYFTLKDATAQLSCVLFARTAQALRGVVIADGRQVELLGEVTVYEARGQYQMIVRAARNRGAGALHAKFDELKRRLEAEGLFAAERKRPLPKFPARVGVVTSATGAAIRDFLHVLHRRHPGIEVIISPVRVQGKGAAAEIAQAVTELSGGSPVSVEVIVLTRGGGSLEDLWEFNEESVARAVAASGVPVISAVGHEIDFTISDFVADVRAPTPSAAAEILSADISEVLLRLAGERERMSRSVGHLLRTTRLRLESWRGLQREPVRRHGDLSQRLDRASEGLTRTVSTTLERRKAAWERLSGRIAPASLLSGIGLARSQFSSGLERLRSATAARVAAQSSRLAALSSRLSGLDPASTLRRGFSITTGEDGAAIRSASTLGKGQLLRTRFADGVAVSRVESTEIPRRKKAGRLR